MGGRGVYSLTGSSEPKVELHSPRTVKNAPATIEKPKLEYLLTKREKDDKSGFFVGVLGYDPANPQALASDILSGLKGARQEFSEPGYNGTTKVGFVMEIGVTTKRETLTVWESDELGNMRLITAYPKKV